MRLRTFVLLVLVLLAFAVLAVVLVLNRLGGTGTGPLADLLPGIITPQQPPDDQLPVFQEQEGPTPEPTPAVRLVSVVVARVHLPVGQRLTDELLTTQLRPDDNIGVQAGVTFDSVEPLIGQILKTEVSNGQEILRPMLALNTTDLAAFGSDLALYIDQGRIAVAFPIDRYTGAAYAIRPGDLVDVLMTLRLIELDPEFQTALPNLVQRVDEQALLEGRAFLFPPTTEGRLQLIPQINLVAEIKPGGEGGERMEPRPRRVTQLTLQQVEVLWMGSWRNPNLGFEQEFNADAIMVDAPPSPETAPGVTPTPTRERPERSPDVAILSMTAQDALALKWALEVGADIHLALRAQGDRSVHITTSVSLPQLVDQGGLTLPEPGEFGLQPRIEEVPTPGVPAFPPQN